LIKFEKQGVFFLTLISSGNADADAIQLSATAGDVDIDGTDITIDGTGGVSIDGVGASNLTTDAGSLTVSTTTSGDVIANAAGTLDLDGDAVTLNSGSGDVDITGATNVDLVATGGDVTISGSNTHVTAGTFQLPVGTTIDEISIDETLADDSDNAVPTEQAVKAYVDNNVDDEQSLQEAYEDGNTIVTDGGNGAFDVSGAEAISLDAGLASNFTVDGDDLTLSTLTSGNLVATSAGNVDIDGTDITIDEFDYRRRIADSIDHHQWFINA